MFFAEAAISNPNNSEEARESARQRLEDMNERGEVDSAEAHAGQVERGHKVGPVMNAIYAPGLSLMLPSSGCHLEPQQQRGGQTALAEGPRRP